ncbi:MAG: substrate-binding domain-containing protein [Kiritimatiellia bacterium]
MTTSLGMVYNAANSAMTTILFITDFVAGSRLPQLSGIREAASERGWHVEEVELARLTEPLASVCAYWKPIGCIVEGSGQHHPTPATFGDVPVVWLDPPTEILENPAATTLVNDNAAIADLAVETLTDTGAAAYAFIGWSRRVRWSREREDRFTARLRALGKTCRILADPWTLGNKTDFATRLRPFLGALPRPCGIFAVNDSFASVILDLCKVDGIAVPGDFHLVGVDDDPAVCDYTTPSLTSIRPNFTQAGRRAVRLLSALVDAASAPHPPGSRPATHETYSPLGVTRRLSTRRITSSRHSIGAAIDLIRREACNGLKAADVVRALAVSERLAETRFKAATGKRITEEITDVRFERVLELLSNPKQAQSAIANLCGWGSSIYLERLFKRRMGMTMRDWRKAHA